MKTPIGRFSIASLGIMLPGGYVVWETQLNIFCRLHHDGGMCCLVPSVFTVECHETARDAWIAHAMIVGALRLGTELPPGEDNGLPFDAADQRAAVLRQLFRSRRPEPDYAVAMSVYRISTGEMPPNPALDPTASPVRQLATG